MLKQIMGVVLLIALCVGGYYLYQYIQKNKMNANGDVKCVENCDTPEEKARFARLNNGDTADGNSEHKQHTAAQDNAIIGAGGGDFHDGSGPQPGGGAATNQLPATQPSQSPVQNGYTADGSQAPPPSGMRMNAGMPASLPVSDSLSPNAPNGMRFGGNGGFQWYRQGNLTWRQNTSTGESCIAYATLEEWRKEIVMSHGCGRNA